MIDVDAVVEDGDDGHVATGCRRVGVPGRRRVDVAVVEASRRPLPHEPDSEIRWDWPVLWSAHWCGSKC